MGPLPRSVLLHGLLGFGSFLVVFSFTMRWIEGTLTWPRTAWELAVSWLVGGSVYGLLRWTLLKRQKRV